MDEIFKKTFYNDVGICYEFVLIQDWAVNSAGYTYPFGYGTTEGVLILEI